MTRYLALIVLPMLLFACSLLVSPPSTGIKSKNYTFTPPDSKWKEIKPDNSDQAFLNSKTKSILIANSLGKKYQSTSRENLMGNILSGIDNVKVEQNDEHKLVSRDALRSYVRGKMDGVPVYMILQVIKKNRCIYDFALISKSKETRLQDESYFYGLLDSLEIE